nr:chorismate mutase [Nanoarchaeum sp.]
MVNNIEILRKEIDKIDDELVELLNKRVDQGKEIIRYKIEKGMDKEDLEREKEIITRLKEKYGSKLVDEIYASIFREVKE